MTRTQRSFAVRSARPRWLAGAFAALLLPLAPRPLRAADDVVPVEVHLDRPARAPVRPLDLLPYLSNQAVRIDVARSLGLSELLGRPLSARGAALSLAPGPLAPSIANGDFDQLVSGDAFSIAGQQDNVGIAPNPVDPSIVVAVAENNHAVAGNARDCTLYVSRDGGSSFQYGVDMPTAQAAPRSCHSPRVAFSADGTRLYVAFLDRGATYAQGLVDLASFDGFSPGAPLSALGLLFPVDAVDAPGLAVHVSEAGGGGAFVYVSSLLFSGSACAVGLSRFSAFGTLVDLSQDLAQSSPCVGPSPLSNRPLKGPQVAAGPGTQVLACWFDAGADGDSTAAQLVPPVPPNPVLPLNKFNVACRSSNDFGATFAGGIGPAEWIYAAKDVASELPFYLGPGASYFDTSSSLPSLAIDHLGNAHLAFSYNPAPSNRFKAESANVAYVSSSDPVPTTLLPTIYSKWSTKTIVAGGAGAQLFPAVAAQHVNESGKPYVYIGWIDTAASSALGPANANAIYQARYRLSTTGGRSFKPAVVASDHASASDFSSIGQYLGAGAGPGRFHLAWTDNRTAFSKFTPRLHIAADRN